MLHITNGDSVVARFRDGGIPGQYLAWADPLHDGPVPETANLLELAYIRARAFAGFGWGGESAILQTFLSKIQALSSFRDHDEVVLWFEHDLFDELLVWQLLDWFRGQNLGAVRLSMVRIDSHPEISPFFGLGQLTGPQLAALLPTRKPVSKQQMDAASTNWRQFCSETPPAGPKRLLEEYPSVGDGLSRLERELLLAAEQGPASRETLYRRAMAFEECPWGDASVFLRLDGLKSATNPAIASDCSLTPAGRLLLDGGADWVALQGGIDRWIGGVHLVGPSPAYRWAPGSGTLIGNPT